MVAIPLHYIQVYGNYDRAFVDKCHALTYTGKDSGGITKANKVLCTFATPDRAFAQIARILAKKKEGSEDPAVIDKYLKVVPLPCISIVRNPAELEMKRFVYVKMNRLYQTRDGQHFYGMWMPAPFILPYQIDVWARTMSDLDEITNQVLLWQRAGDFYLTVSHPIPFGTRIVLTEYKGMTHTGSELDPRDNNQRMLRRSFSFVVHGWICPPAIECGIVEKVIAWLYDNTLSTPGTLLDTVTTIDGPAGTPVPVIPPDLETSVMTTLFGVLIVGEAAAGTSYGDLVVPAPMTIVGLQATVLGALPAGGDLEFQLTLNGGVDATKTVTIAAGARTASVTFGAELPVVAGQRLGVRCVSTGLPATPGSWVEVRFNVALDISYT